MYEKIKRYYDKGIYKERHLRALTAAGAITPGQFEAITGVAY